MWFMKICAQIFAGSIPNWFLNWWSYHDPTINFLLDPFLKLYKEWVKIYFFIEFFIPWIQKWTLKVGFTEEQIPCLYRTFYNNIWDKLMKKDPKTKTLYGQELLNLFAKRIHEYVRHIARKISIQDGDKEAMINNNLEEVNRSLLLNITQYEKSDSSMRSETSEDATDNIQEAQPVEAATSEDTLKKGGGFPSKIEGKRQTDPYNNPGDDLPLPLVLFPLPLPWLPKKGPSSKT
ncbi:hypothetical protein H5410_037235 [Solanum commersonii]|uniref:Uncharacterized protein n=1 Tax=Solanum commersonii TaxID=4109 RepID=A0A9J5Y5P7_SOLCO|nr:hypothetical protein H5410_037235 [Solanum commersonii]